MRIGVAALLLALVSLAPIAGAHEVRPAQFNVTETGSDRYLVRWKVPAREGATLGIEPVFEEGIERIGDIAERTTAGTSLQTFEVHCPGGLAGKQIAFPKISTTMIDVLVQVRFLDGRVHTGVVRPKDPVFHIPERDSQPEVFKAYLTIGIEHILLGYDHLLFVLGMALLIVDLRRLLGAITGFTIAHSLTLALATLDVVRVPGPPVEAVIALSILMLAVEGRRFHDSGEPTLGIRRPWLVSGSIGLIHGLGFAGTLAEYGLPAHARFISLLAFNLGVELGQIGFLAALFPLAFLAERMRPGVTLPLKQVGLWFIGVAGAFWFLQRCATFV